MGEQNSTSAAALAASKRQVKTSTSIHVKSDSGWRAPKSRIAQLAEPRDGHDRNAEEFVLFMCGRTVEV